MTQGQQTQYCERCGRPLTYIPQYNAWYCYYCRQYSRPRAPPTPTTPTPTQQSAPQTPYTDRAYQTSYESYETYPKEEEVKVEEEKKCPKCGHKMEDNECKRCKAEGYLEIAEDMLEVAVVSGMDVKEAEEHLAKARDAFDLGEYDMVKKYVSTVEKIIEAEEKLREKLEKELKSAEEMLNEYRGRGVDVRYAEKMLQLAQSFFRMGDADKTRAFIRKCEKTAKEAEERKEVEMKEKIAEEKLKCPRCGEPTQPGWRRCPNCGALLIRERVEVEEVVKKEEPMEEVKEEEAVKKAEAEEEFESEEHRRAKELMDEVNAIIEKVSKEGVSTVRAENLLKLAKSFYKSGSYEKTIKYAEKAKKILEK